MTNPSGRKMHWAVLAKENRHWKAMVNLMVCGHRPKAPLKRARLTLTRFSSVSPDSDGLVSGFKRIIDGLVASGVLENDRYENIGMPQYLWQKEAPGRGRVHIKIEEIV